MKAHQIKTINLRKLYLLALIGVIISIFILILLISATVYLFPKFDYISLFIVFYSVIIGNLMSRIITNKSSKLIEIKINKSKLEIGDEQFLLEAIDKIKINNFIFTYYPKLTINFFDNKKFTIRIDRSKKDYSKLLFNLKEITIKGRKIM